MLSWNRPSTCSPIQTTWPLERGRAARPGRRGPAATPGGRVGRPSGRGDCLLLRACRRLARVDQGELLARMVEHGFTILVTADRNLAYQQPLARVNLATVVVTRPLHRAAVLARVAAIAEAVRSVQPGGSIEVPAS